MCSGRKCNMYVGDMGSVPEVTCIVLTLGLATPSIFCRPATPTGSLLFAAPRPERPSDPANPGCLGLERRPVCTATQTQPVALSGTSPSGAKLGAALGPAAAGNLPGKRGRACRGGRAQACLLASGAGRWPTVGPASRGRRPLRLRCRAVASAPTRHGRGLLGGAFKKLHGRRRTRVAHAGLRRRLSLSPTDPPT